MVQNESLYRAHHISNQTKEELVIFKFKPNIIKKKNPI